MSSGRARSASGRFERAEATPLGRRLERRGVGSGSHGRPEPSARAPSARAPLKAPRSWACPGTRRSTPLAPPRRSPSNFNPLDLSGAYTGTQGLLYEPLFLYDPVHGRFIPWLATSGSLGEARRRTSCEVRGNVDWTASPSGAVTGALSGADVAYTVNLAVGGQG